MSTCEKCGKYTDGYRLCYSCYKQKNNKAGFVYGLDSKRSDGSNKVYVGSTGRTPHKRWGEHFDEIKRTDSKTWVGKGLWAKPIGAFWSSNRWKAEKTMKSKTASEKKRIFRRAAKKYSEDY